MVSNAVRTRENAVLIVFAGLVPKSMVHRATKDYIKPNELVNFHDASIEIGNAFYDYNKCWTHSSIDYLPPREFRRKFLDEPALGKKFEKKEVEVTLDE